MTENIASPALAEEISPAQRQNVDALAESINLMDPQLTITYGTQTMQEIAGFADSILSSVRAKDAGPVGESLTSLMVQIKQVDIESVTGTKKGFLESLPVLGSLFNSAERTMAEFKTLSGQVDIITQKLDEAMHSLLVDIATMEQLYQHNRKFHDDLTISILAGQKRLEHARTVELPDLQKKAEASQDSMDAQTVRDFAERINRFERRLHDLQISRTITLQTAPQIRLIQSNNQTLAEKIQTSILATIPIWKNQMVLSLSLHKQKTAAQMQKNVSDTTNELLRKNASMLESATIDTAREVERSIVDVETVRDVHSKLLSTIEETLKITQEGRERRRDVEKELAEMEGSLRKQLTTLAQDKTAASIAHAQGEALPGATAGSEGNAD